MNLRLALAALLLSTTAPLVASAAQPWIEDRRYGEGPGIRTGNLELHPSLAGEFGYDSNYFQRGPNDLDPQEERLPVVDALRFRITPSFTMSTLSSQRTRDAAGGPGSPPLLSFSSGAFLTYNAFIPLDDGNDFDDRSRTSGGANLLFRLFPERPITWDVHGGYRRIIDPSSVATGDFDFDRHSLEAGSGLTWSPGGGLFNWRAGYRFRGTFFSEGDYDAVNNAQHTIETRGRWRFLPRTAFLYDGYYRMIRFSDSNSGQDDGDIIQSRVGVAGLVTNRFAFRVMAGWAASFYGPNAQDFDGPVGNAEVKWFLTPNPALQPGSAAVGLSSIAVGYERNYAHSYLGPFYQRDRGYLTFEYFIGGVVVTSLTGHVAKISYPDFLIPGDPEPETGVSETRIGGQLFAEYRASEMVGINTTLMYDQNISDDEIDLDFADGDPGGAQDDLAFSRFQGYIGARVFW